MWATRVMRMAVKKTTTGIVGLPVNANARQDLIKIYQKTLQEVKVRSAAQCTQSDQKAQGDRHKMSSSWLVLPEDAVYRTSVERITNYRLKVVLDNEDENVIEKEINMGQLEELIEQAEDELSVIPVYLENKLWEPPASA